MSGAENPVDTLPKTEKAWAVCGKDYGSDGRGDCKLIPKRFFDSKQEAENAVFPPYVVAEIDIEINATMDRMKSAIGPAQRYLMTIYRGDAIVDHLLGNETLVKE